MKAVPVLLLLGLVYCASAAITPHTKLDWNEILKKLRKLGRDAINKQILRFLDGQRQHFPTGWPALGIPPLDPLDLPEVSFDLPKVGAMNEVRFRLHDAHLRGLQNFDVVELDWRIIGTYLHFNIYFPYLEIDGQHETHTDFLGFDLHGEGEVNFVLNGVNIIGSVEVSFLEGGYANIDTLYIGVTVESAESHLKGFGLFDAAVNAAINAALPTLINEGQSAINELLSGVLLPSINAVLHQFNILDVLVAIIQAITGASSLPVETAPIEVMSGFEPYHV